MCKRVLSIFLIILLILSCAGCEQKKEMINLAKVMAIGVDAAPDGKYIVSIRILTESTTQKSAGTQLMQKGGGGPTESTVYVGTGYTIIEAVNKLNKELGKEIRFSHNKVIIIGEETARKSISNILDYSLRLFQMRPNIPIIIAKGTALEVMMIATPENPLPPAAIEDLLTQQERTGYAPYSTNLDIANAILSESTAPIAAVIKRETNNLTNAGTFKVEGTAVFKKDKLIGYMNEKETRGLEWVIGNIKLSAVVLGDVKKGSITTVVLNSSAKVTPILGKDGTVIKIDIKTRSNIREMTADLDIIKNPKILDALNESQSKVIKYEVEEAVNAAQNKLKADVFGFGEEIYRKHPEEWEKIKDKWNDQFQYCKVEVTVHSNIKSPGSLSNTIIK